jgi:spermidine/putrescine-binding protein
VIKDYGITMFFFDNKVVTEHPKSMHDFYELLPKYGKVGRTNLLDGAEEVVPLALMALGLDPNTDSSADLAKAKDFLLSIRSGVTTIDSSGYINDAIAGKIILSQGWNGDVRRIVQARKKQGDITPIIPTEMSEIWADNWCIPASAPHPVAAHAWINWLLEPAVAVGEMNYHNYPIPIPTALSQMPASLRDDPLFNVPKAITKNYRYILNVSPSVVNQRTQIYTEFKAA